MKGELKMQQVKISKEGREKVEKLIRLILEKFNWQEEEHPKVNYIIVNYDISELGWVSRDALYIGIKGKTYNLSEEERKYFKEKIRAHCFAEDQGRKIKLIKKN